MFTKKTKLEQLATQKKKLVAKRKRILTTMTEANSQRGTKVQELQNASMLARNEAEKAMNDIDRLIAKIMRDIESEQTYANEIAESEKKQYEEEKKDIIITKEDAMEHFKKGGE